MATFDDVKTCLNCGESFWTQIDLKTGQVTVTSACICIRRINHKDRIIGLYAQHNAGLQQQITDIAETLKAFLNGTLSDAYSTLEDLVEDIEIERSSWQAQDTWKAEPDEDEGE